MKTLALVLMIACGSAALAQENAQDHAAHAATLSTDSPNPMKMQDRMQEMRSLMKKLDETKDPEEHDRILQQHLKAMHEQMDDMKRMGGMMDCHDAGSSKMDMMMDMMGQMLHREDAKAAHH